MAAGRLQIVRGISFEIAPGEILGLVGESGCGKSMTSLAIMGLLPPGMSIAQGRILLNGADVTDLAPHQRVRQGCGKVAMVFQEPMTSLNPVLRIGDQIEEAIRVHDTGGHARRPRARASGHGPHSRRRPSVERLSARTVRRDAPAGDDRHRAGLPALPS